MILPMKIPMKLDIRLAIICWLYIAFKYPNEVGHKVGSNLLKLYCIQRSQQNFDNFWQILFGYISTNFIQRNFDKFCSVKFWQILFGEILTNFVWWNFDQFCLLKFCQILFIEILTNFVLWNFNKFCFVEFQEI